MNIIQNSFIFLSILPFFPFLIVYYGYYWWKNNKNTALLLAMDVTTLFLIISVSALFNNVFRSKFGFYLILLFILLAIGLIGSAQNRLRGKINIPKMSRLIWRALFLIMSVSYIFFTLFGIIKYILLTNS
ncbi:DUF3397 domain-containing protein [Paenibacillus pini]|uniref:DUF3397 domain-containing protein n=1 Tax=Paenibacillus pini TaxID=669461 RepID=UPI000561AE51|nr:DUF3397 domain-containing protein [Paenibacillus pini]